MSGAEGKTRHLEPFESPRQIARRGSEEASTAECRGDRRSMTKKAWRKSLDNSMMDQFRGVARSRSGSWNHPKDRSESARRTRAERGSSSTRKTSRGQDSPLVARVIRSGSAPLDSWDGIDQEARDMAREEELPPCKKMKRRGSKGRRTRSYGSSGGDSDRETEESVPPGVVEGEEEEEEEAVEHVVRIRVDAKDRVKARKMRTTPRGNKGALALDLSAISAKEEQKSVAIDADDAVSPRKKMGRTSGGGFLSARGLDSIQIRKKTLNFTNRSSRGPRPARHASSPAGPDPAASSAAADIATNVASWLNASDELLERRALKRERVMTELLMTERKFVSVLEALVEFVLQPMRSNGVAPEEDVATIFANIEDILRLNEALLTGMENCMGKKRRRLGGRLSRTSSPGGAGIPTEEALPAAAVRKLLNIEAGIESSSPPVGQGMRKSSSNPSSRCSSPKGPSPLSSSPQSPSPRTPRSPPAKSPLASPRSPSTVAAIPTAPSNVAASPVPPIPVSPAPVPPKTRILEPPDAWATRCDTLGSLFMAYSEKMSIHTEFCSNHSRLLAEKKLKKMREENAALARFLETCLLRPECRGQTLEAMLITIPQRVCRYPMLLLELLKNTPPTTADYELLVEAWQSVRDVVAEINAATEVASDFGALLDVQQVLQLAPSLGMNLLQSHRKFITRGVFKVAKVANYAFLFNDCLILARVKGEFYKAKRVIRLSKLILRATGPGGQPIKQGAFSIQLAEIGERILAVEFGSQQEMDQWVKHLQVAMSSCSSDMMEAESVSRMSTTHALASTMASLVGPLSPRGKLSGNSSHSQAEMQRKRSVTKRQKKAKNRTLPRTLIMNGLGSNPSSPAVGEKEGAISELEKETRRRRAAEARVKELEAEVKSLKKLLGEKSMLVGALQGKLEKGKADKELAPKKKRSGRLHSTKSASNLLSEFGEALAEASPGKGRGKTRKTRKDEEASEAEEPPMRAKRIGSAVSFPEVPTTGEEGEEEGGSRGSPVIFVGRSHTVGNGSPTKADSPTGTPPQRRRTVLSQSGDLKGNSPAASPSRLPPPSASMIESADLQQQILLEKKQWEEKEAERKKKRKHRISVALLKK